MTGFVIHALPVLNGILAIAPLPGAGGDYEADMEHLRDWRPAMVMSLTTSAEMRAAAAGDLGRAVMEMGARWVHMEVPDFGTPDAAGMAAWRKSAPLALSALRGGGRVLIHCRGGCGRSGMAALRLMIEAGEPPDDALARLRRTRDCAVETTAQMRWSRQGMPPPAT
ncbi:protein-tyrosine phosphatase family protein [Roseovarius nanhaiticus]|uniref:protein-tyrosine phosphatase family protein n=1 Tax=Roseovarius nanhaiticus TaxID=573024 RepID=UPI002490A92E|nr:protein phosphatase [Roseovarius nanhaiticus]